MQDLDDFAKSDLDKLERLADNFKWIHNQEGNLKEKYESKFVAIKDKKILNKNANQDRQVNKKTR